MTQSPWPLPSDLEPGEEDLFVRRLACPSPERLLAAREGVLAPALQEETLAHLQSCVFCQVLAEALGEDAINSRLPQEADRIDTRIAGASRERPAASGDRVVRVEKRPLHWWAAGLAAAATVVLVAGATFLLPLRSGRVPAVVAAPTSGFEPAGPRPVSVLALDRPMAALPEDQLVWRGGLASERENPRETLNRAFDRLAARDRDGLRAELAGLTARRPESGDDRLYAAVGLLLLDRAADAASQLERAAQDLSPELEAEREWYLSLARLSLGDDRTARATLDRLCAGTSERSAMACAGLMELDDRAVPLRRR